MRLSLLARAACASLACAVVVGAAHAQTVPATTFLPAGHWSVDAARRLDALDRDVRFDGGARTPSLADVVAVIAHAAERPAGDAVGDLARGYLARLQEEFRESLDGAALGTRPVAASATLGVGAQRLTGQLAPGPATSTTLLPPPRPGDDRDGVTSAATVAARAGRRAALRVDVTSVQGDVRVADAQVVLGLGPLGIWAGRRAPAYGPSSLGGVTIGGAASFDGAGIFLLRGSRLPGLLRYIGPWHAEVWGARLDSSYLQRHPYFAGGRLSIAPLRVLQLGWNRGVIFGGDHNLPITAQRLVDLAFIGFRHGKSGFENQVMSFDARLTPVFGGVPVVGHLEWGTEDAAGAIHHVPGIVAGLELPIVPGAPWLAFGTERSSFAHSCCRNPPWARHAIFRDGWTNEGALIGHPLGGEGHQLAVYARGDLLDARIRTRLTGFTRVRGEENIFAPDWQGRSVGASASAIVRLTPRAELQASGSFERGAAQTLGTTARPSWHSGVLATSVRLRF